MRELWRDVVGYEGLYEVSSLGRVKTLRKFRHCKDGKIYRLSKTILSYNEDAHGYPVVNLTSSDGKSITKKVHRLMAIAFLPNPENKRCVDHINGIRNDNRLENLRWATHSENQANTVRLNHLVSWEDRNISRESRYNFTHSQSRAVIRSDGKEYESIAEASRVLGLKSASAVSLCVRGLLAQVRGYSFKYKDEELNKRIESIRKEA